MNYPKEVSLLRTVKMRKEGPARRKAKEDRIGTRTGWMCDDVDGVGCLCVGKDSRCWCLDQVWTRMGWRTWMLKEKIVKTQTQKGKRNEAEDDGWSWCHGFHYVLHDEMKILDTFFVGCTVC